MAMPFYTMLRNKYSNSKITFLSPEVLGDFPDEGLRDDKILMSTDERKISKAFVKKALELKQEKYDLAISLPSSFSSAFFLCLSGATQRVGFAAGGSELFFHASIQWKGNTSLQHKSALYASLFEFLTAQKLDDFDGFKKNSGTKENYIVIAPGASLPLREYPYFSELLLELSQSYPDYKLVLIGSKNEEKYNSQVKRLKLPNVENRIGRTSLPVVIDLCRNSSLVISNDSGVAHLSASIAGAMTLVLMGPGDPDYILPLGGNAFAVREEGLPCSPCEKAYCRAAYGYQACLKRLLPEKVIERMKTLTP